MRNWRRDKKDMCIMKAFKWIYKLYNMVYYALRPFLGASALYFDICKDIVFAILIHDSLKSLTQDVTISYPHFEYGLFYTLVLSIALVQVNYF